MSGRISIVNFFPGDYDTTIKKLIELKMCTSSKNSVDSLKKKKKLKQQSRFFLQHFLPHLTLLSILYTASMHYCRHHHSEHPGNILDFKALPCTPAHSTCEVQCMRQLIRRTHQMGCTGGAKCTERLARHLELSHHCSNAMLSSTLKPKLPKYTLRPMKYPIPHQIPGMESEGLTR